MRSALLIALLFLIPFFILINDQFSWEEFALTSVHRTSDITSVRAKLLELGESFESDYENFRLKQLFYCGAITLPIVIFLLVNGNSLTSVIGILILLPITVFIFLERSLSRRVSKYRSQIDSDFPGVVEMMTLALSAGESPLTVLQRISSRGQGPLTREFSLVIEDVKEGRPFSQALDSMGRRVHSISVRRFVDALVTAATRGAPLIDVLHSHAKEARDFQRNLTLAAAGKSEISMMIPVVFLILPISILFALWPSLSNLNLFATG